MVKEYNVAILGATGAVGRRMIEQLEQSTIPVKSLKLLASSRSAGTVLKFKDQDLTVEETRQTTRTALSHQYFHHVVSVTPQDTFQRYGLRQVSAAFSLNDKQYFHERQR